jgi:hypothetical protein
MKRQIFLILVVTMAVAMLQADLSDAGFVMNNVEQMGFEPFDIHVSSSDLQAGDQAISFQFLLSYDPLLLDYNGYSAGVSLPGMLVVNDLTPGLLNVAYADATILTGINELMILHFTPIEPCETAITMTNARYNNTDITDITGGSIIITDFPEISFAMEDVLHQGLTAFDATVYSNDIQTEDGIISYQFSYHYDSSYLEFVDYSYGANLSGQLVVNAQEPGVINAAYSGADAISGINELIIITFQPIAHGYSTAYLSNMVMNNYILEETVQSEITIYPLWDEVSINVTGADVFTGDQFVSTVETSLIMIENGVISFQFVLTYDAELLEYAGVYEDPERTIYDLVINDTEPGVIQAAFAISDPIYGEGSVVDFLFNAIDDGVTQIALTEFVYNNEYILNLTPGEVTITNPNNPPVANAGEDFDILEGEEGVLDGSASYDPNDDEITYLWEGLLDIDDPFSATPAFTAPLVDETTDFIMTLTVDDGEFTDTDEVVVTVINIPNPGDAVITVDNIETSFGEEITAGIYTTPLNPEFEVISFQYIISYNADIIEYTGFAEGEIMPDGILAVNGDEPGLVQVAFASSDPIGAAAALNYLNFTALSVGATDLVISEFYYNNTEVLNLVSGGVTVHEPFYFVEVYAEDINAGLDMEFTCNVITGELLEEWNIISYQFHLYYDPTMLQYTGYEMGSVAPQGNLLAFEVEPGHLSVAYAHYNALSGAGSLAGFNFIPVELGSTEIEIEQFKYNATFLPQVDSGTIDIVIPYTNAVISAPELTVGGGSTFTVGISTSEIISDWNVISFQFDLGFDPEFLDYVGYSAGSIIDSGNLLAFENADGNVSIAFADFMPIEGEGTLIELEFAASTSLGESVLDIENFKYNSLYLDNDNINDGLVTIIHPYADAVITCSDADTREGLNFTVGISTSAIQPEWGVISFQFNLGYDTEYLDYVGYEAGEVITSGNLLAYENADGNISVAFADFMSISGEGELIVLEFTALLEGETVLDLNQFKYNSLYLDNLIDGTVTIIVGDYPPVAVAGNDQVVDEGEFVQLDGTASYDPDDFLRDTPNWYLNPPDFEYNGFIWGVVEFNGVQVTDVNDMIGVFVGDECRGIAQQSDDSVQDYTNIAFGHVAFMPQVYSNVTSGETFSFLYYDASAGMIYDVEETLDWTADMVVGNGFDPFVFTVTAEPTYDLTFNWLAPAGIELDDPSSPTPSFIAPWVDADTDFVIGLEVFDGELWSEIDEVVITVIDHPLSEVVVYAPEQEVIEYETVDVPVLTTNLQPDMNVISYQFSLEYDPELLSYDGHTAGPLSPDMLVVNNIQPGLINAAYANPVNIVGSGELLSFHFTAIEGGISPIHFVEFKYNNTFINAVDGFVDVINVNDPPVFNLPDEFSFNEDEMLIEDFSQYISDPDNDTHTIIPLNNVNILIAVDGYEVTMTAPENWFGSEMVTFLVDDNSGRATDMDMVMINVLPVNDPPVLNVPPVMYFEEDGEMIFDIAEYVYDVDNEIEELLLYVTGMVNLAVEVEGLVATISATENWYGEELLTFTVDDQQGRATASDNCLFIVEPVNDPPVLELPEYISFNEDESLVFDVSPYAYDVDEDDLNIVSVEYDEINLFAAFEGMVIDFHGAENWFGTTEVAVTITDNVNRLLATDYIIVEVLPVNDPPEIDLPESFTFLEDESLTVDFTPYVFDIEDDELILSVSGGVEVFADITGLEVIFTASENWYGEEELTFTVDDQQGRAVASDNVLIIVEPVNDPPVLQLPEYISFNEDESLVFDVSPYAYDVDEDDLNIFSVEYDEINLFAAYEGMVIDFHAAENWFGITEVAVTITDNVNRLFATDYLIVEVLPVNDPPEIDLPESFTFLEDESLTIDFTPYIFDIDEDELILSVSGGVEVFANITGLEVIFTASENWYGEEELTFTIDDQQGRAIASDNVLIIVEPVNDPPVIDFYAPVETEFTLSDTTEIIFSIDYTDIEGDAAISWYVGDQLLPGINDADFAITFDRNGDFTVRVELADAEYSTEVTWQIHVWMGPDWQPVVYPSNTIAYTRVTIDGLPASTLDMVGAFVGGEMRGWSHPIVSQTDQMTYATIVISGVQIEEINFILYDYSENAYYDLYETYTTNPGGEIGTPPNYINLAFGSGDGPNWTPVIYTNSTIIYGTVQIEGIPADENDRVGVFVGPECRAVADVVISDRHTAVVTLIVQGDTPEIAQFKVWDASEDIILSVPMTIVTNPGGVIGYPPDLILINATESATLTQSINLATGWNLISLNIYPSSYMITDIFSEQISAGNLLKIKDIFNSYDPNLPPVYNTLTEFEDGFGYYVRVAATDILEVTGLPVNVQETSIPLLSGWNLAGYLPQQPQALETALESIMPSLLKIKDSFGSYDPSLPPEFNTLSTLNPGSGYWIQMSANAVLSYPSGITRYDVTIDNYHCPIWEAVIYTNSTIAYGKASLNGMPAEGYIAAFVDGECRAAHSIENGNLSLVINGEKTEEVYFKLYNNGTIYESNQSVSTDPGNDVSDLVVFFGNGEAPSVTRMTSIYPNPFNPQTTIGYELSQPGNVRLEVFNIKGQKIASLLNNVQQAGEYKYTWNATEEVSGVYFLRFQTDGHSETRKVILMK